MRAVLTKLKRSGLSRWLPVVILFVHLTLGVVYSVVTPLWESFDEWGHYPYVEYVAEERELPQEPLTDSNDETHQPPLYYVLAALATFWVDTGDDLQTLENDYSVHRGGQGGVNFYLHLEDERFPYRGRVLAAHVARLVSVLLGTVAVFATYLTGRTLFPERRGIALGAMAVSGFWPQLLFVGGVVNNDVMVTASASLVLLFVARMFVGGPRFGSLVGLGLSLGAALLSKRNGLAMVPFALCVLIVTAVRRRSGGDSPGLLIAGVLLFSASVIGALAWVFSDAGRAYRAPVMSLASVLRRPAELGQLHWGRLPGGLYFCLVTFFASFGHLLLGVEPWVYQLVAVVCLAAGVGLVASLKGQGSDRASRIGVAILLGHLLAVLAAPAYRTLSQVGEPASPTVVGSVQADRPLLFARNVFLFQGRFALPAISSFSLLLVLGLSRLVPERSRGRLLLGLSVVLLLFSAIAPFRYIRPAYARPRRLSPSVPQRVAHPLGIRFGESIELVGYDLDIEAALAGESVPVTLYWRCLNEMERNYTLTIELLGMDDRGYGSLRLHPGRGNYPTSLWERGESFRETYRIPVAEAVPTPSRAYVRVTFRSAHPSPADLEPQDEDGKPVSATFGQIVVRAAGLPEIEHPVHYELGGAVALVGYEIQPAASANDRLDVTLFWQALTEVESDYTVLVHLIDEDGELISQGDSQPNGGLSPTTIWQEGDVVEDRHVVDLPGADERPHSVRVGMYDLATMERLPAFDEDGRRLTHDVIELRVTELSAGCESGSPDEVDTGRAARETMGLSNHSEMSLGRSGGHGGSSFWPGPSAYGCAGARS